jgi:hypothetical protein
MGEKGQEFPCEAQRLRDEHTGATLWQMTSHRCINHHLYFLTSSFLPDERSLVFARFRDGAANFYRAGFPEGPITQLTDSADINSFSAVISRDGSRLFFTRGSSIIGLSLINLYEEVLADFPGGKLGEVDLSADGKWIVSAIRLEGQHGIVVAATDGSGGEVVHRQTRTIIHPQFHPTDPHLIEYAADPAPRMYLIRRDGTENRCLYAHGNDEFIVHETWLGDTGDLMFTVWPKALKRFRLSDGEITTIAEFNAWHICATRDGRTVMCDTNHPDIGVQLIDVASGRRRTVCHPGSSNRGSQWPKGRYALKADFEEAAKAGASDLASELSWMEMKTDTIYGPQWTHPHPSFSGSERFATFTSDRTGYPQVYVVELPAG